MYTQDLADRLREVILNGTWVAYTNYKDQLDTLNWKYANVQVENLNSIGLLARHIHYYIAGVIHALETSKLEIRDKYSFDFAPITSEEEWKAFLQTFYTDAEKLASIIEKLSDEQMDKPFIDEKYGFFLRNLNGMIEHCYYHLGQIVILKKMIIQKNA